MNTEQSVHKNFKMPNPTSTRWVFTLNNYTDDEFRHICDFHGTSSLTRYLIVGKEVGQHGTPHLQGFVIFHRNCRLAAVRNHLSQRAHFERALGTSAQASQYCKKEHDFFEFGELPSNSGKRNDIEDFIQWGQDFIRTTGRAPTSPEIAVERPREYLRYPRATKLFANQAPPPTLREGEPLAWQQELEALLEVEADDRVIRFYVDEEGGKGKTWFQQYFFTKYPEKVQILGIGRREDLTYAIDVSKSIFFFNVPRDGMQFLQYTVLEQLKDRMVFSTKYQSVMKILSGMVHVVVFCNEMPNMTKMSADRFDIKYL